MARLLSGHDFTFLRKQPGFEPRIEKRLWRERRGIFRAYFRQLKHDFRSLHHSLRELILASPTDQSDVLRELSRQNVRFVLLVARVELLLLLHPFGIATPIRDVSALAQSAAALRELMANMQPRWSQAV